MAWCGTREGTGHSGRTCRRRSSVASSCCSPSELSSPRPAATALVCTSSSSSYLATFHQWSFDPHLFEWALYPMAWEHFQGIGWMLGGEQAARLVQFGFTLAAIAAIVAVARRVTSPAAALLAGSLFASAGMAFGLAANTYAEPALTAFCLGAFLVVTLPREGWSTWTSAIFGLLCGGCLPHEDHGPLPGPAPRPRARRQTRSHGGLAVGAPTVRRCGRRTGGRRLNSLPVRILAHGKPRVPPLQCRLPL